MSGPSLPRFLLGHNALIGINHQDRTLPQLKTRLGDADRAFLRAAAAAGVRGMVLDNHPVATEAAAFIADACPGIEVLPMVPYAQAVVNEVSRGGVRGLLADLAKTGLSMGSGDALRIARRLAAGNLPGAGARAGLARYVRDFPQARPPVVFLHNVVTDLLVGWRAARAVAEWAAACRERGSAPGFVTLNPTAIPWLRERAGDDAWFMCAVNSRGVQMSPSREAAEEVLADRSLRVVAMSVLAGGVLKAEEEIPRALSFPAVRSVVIGTTRIANVNAALSLAHQSRRVEA